MALVVMMLVSLSIGCENRDAFVETTTGPDASMTQVTNEDKDTIVDLPFPAMGIRCKIHYMNGLTLVDLP